MKQSKFLRMKGMEEMFLGSDIVRKYSFKTVGTREESALFQEDCFECRSPRKTAA